jgi:hypothetical protein
LRATIATQLRRMSGLADALLANVAG